MTTGNQTDSAFLEVLRGAFNDKSNSKHIASHISSANGKSPEIEPATLAVIAALLGGALTVDSILITKDQEVEVTLIGSLKKKTQLEKTMDQIGSLPFDQVIKAMLGRLT